MTEEDLARCQLLHEKPFEHVIAMTHAEYKTYLYATKKVDRQDAQYVGSRDGLYGVTLSVIVLLGDRFSASMAYDDRLLNVMGWRNIIVEKGLGGNIRRYWDAAE